MNEDNKVIMEKHYFVSFFIGKKYLDNIWCALMAMDAYHIQLGKAWQKDRNVVFDIQEKYYI